MRLRRRGRAPSPPAVSPVEPRRADDMAERLRIAFDALPVGLVLADADGNVVLRNHMAEHAAGAFVGEVLVREAVEARLKAAIAGERTSQTLELFGPPPRVLVIHATPVEGGGALATIEDATERARVDATRTDFVSNVSHELKTPVGAISILAETLADTDDPEVVGRLAGKILLESDRVAQTIDDLLELSRIEMGGDAVREPVDVGTVVEEAADRVRQLAERSGIKLVLRAPLERLTVFGDRRQLVSALGNLIENAVKYSEADGSVEVSAACDGEEVLFRVVDHGIGIAPKHLDRIFERFYRVDRARSRATGGTGLGLSIVRHVATNHGGQVSVTSREGEGSTFVLHIPAGPSAAALDEPDVTLDAVMDDVRGGG